jgi:signal transduction histidine kinase
MTRKDTAGPGQAPKHCCPMTGLSIVQRPEWTFINFGRDYLANFSILGGRILLSRPQGYITQPDAAASLALMDRTALEIAGEAAGYVLIEDLSGLRGASFEARRYFINHMKKTDRMMGLIFYNVSPVYRLSFKLANRFYRDPRPVQIADSYSEAVKIAGDILAAKGISLESDALFSKESAQQLPEAEREDAQRFLTVQKSPGWNLDLDGYTVGMEIIDNSILHSVSSGFMRENHVNSVSRLRLQIVREKGDGRGFDYLVACAKDVKGNTRNTRKLFMADLRAFHEKYPFRAYIFYGASRHIRAAANLAKPFMPFKVYIANDFHEAMDFIRKDQQKKTDQADEKSKNQKKGPIEKQYDVQRYADELLHFLGSINWEMSGFAEEQQIPENHPFYHVYEGLRLIKGELDELFLEKEAQKKEKTKLQEQLLQARKMETIGTMTGGIAHDFNNILGIILGNTELALTDIPNWNPLHEYLLEIRSASLRAKDVVGNLLCFSHESSEGRKPLDLVSVVKESVDFLRSFISANIDLHETMPGHCRPILADPVQIRQLMTNLCSNAVHAMEKDGGTLTVSIEAVELAEEDLDGDLDPPPGKFVKLTVSDTGQGIDPKHMDRIFDPYFTTKDIGKGGGMGLAVVHGIVKGHKGSIKIDSEPGMGTAISIFFPVSDPKEKT